MASAWGLGQCKNHGPSQDDQGQAGLMEAQYLGLREGAAKQVC